MVKIWLGIPDFILFFPFVLSALEHGNGIELF